MAGAPRWLLICALSVVAGCAPAVAQQPAHFTADGGTSFRLARVAEISLSTGYSTRLRAGSRWELVGRVPQGEVYRTSDHIVTVEGAHIHEAYIVVNQGSLVGFYLPTERTFSPATPPQPLSIEP